MKTSFLAALAIACVACGSGGSGGSGGIDKAAFDRLLEGTHHGDAWATASAGADKVLGPARIKDADRWVWAVVEGDECWELDLMKDGDKVSGVSGGVVGKMLAEPFARCVARSKGAEPR